MGEKREFDINLVFGEPAALDTSEEPTGYEFVQKEKYDKLHNDYEEVNKKLEVCGKECEALRCINEKLHERIFRLEVTIETLIDILGNKVDE